LNERILGTGGGRKYIVDCIGGRLLGDFPQTEADEGHFVPGGEGDCAFGHYGGIFYDKDEGVSV
jgi:hypothetical protein